MGGVCTNIGYGINIETNGDVYTTENFQRTENFDPSVGVFNLTVSGHCKRHGKNSIT